MKALFNIPYGLYILTVKENEKINGCVINTTQQITSNPTQISITINKDNYTTKMIENTGVFNVSILDKTTNFDLIKNFGFSTGKETNKFENFKDFEIAENGVPFITQKDAITGGERLNIINDVNGILFGDFAELEDIILKTKLQIDTFVQMGENAKQYYLKNRTKNHMVDGFMESINYIDGLK